MTPWEDDPRTDAELLAAYCEPLDDGHWVFTHDGVVPRTAANMAELIRADLLLGCEPTDKLPGEAFSRLIMKIRELDRRLTPPGR